MGAASFPFASDALREDPELEKVLQEYLSDVKSGVLYYREKTARRFFAIRRGTIAVRTTAAQP